MAKGKAKNEINQRTQLIKTDLTKRFKKLKADVEAINEGTDLVTLNKISQALQKPVSLSSTLSISISDCHSSGGKYSKALPAGYEKAITKVQNAINKLHSLEVEQQLAARTNEDVLKNANSIKDLEKVTHAPMILSDGTKVKAGDLYNVQTPHFADARMNVGDEKLDAFKQKAIQIKQAKPFQKNFDAIDSILKTFADKIEHIGTHKPEAKTKAEELLEQLKGFRNEAFKNASKESLAIFAANAKQAIAEAIPMLQKDLGWGDYLRNLMKIIANAVITVVTVGTKQNFFAEKTSKAVMTAKGLHNELSEDSQTEVQPK